MTASNRQAARVTLRKDAGIFADPGFLVTLAILLALFAVAAIVLLYGADERAVPLRLW